MAGAEDRKQILPTPPIPKTPGILGPDYSFADNLKLPGEVGVRTGDDFASVADSIKAVGYYVDMIGFGEPSSGLTRGMPLTPLGVNTWMKTGQTCSNGAEAWQYVEGIPTGGALGKRFADGLKSAGFPAMRGLAPGILEDVQGALNPKPLLQAVFGSAYPQCTFVKKPVGDQDNRLQNKDGAYYVDNPETVEKGTPNVQGRWMPTASMSREDWDKTPKTHCPDGYPVKNHRGGDCTRELTSSNPEGFGSPEGLRRVVLLAVAATGTLLLLHKFK